MGAPFLGESLQFLKDPFGFTLARTRQHPEQDVSPAGGGLGPLPRSQLRVAIARRAR